MTSNPGERRQSRPSIHSSDGVRGPSLGVSERRSRLFAARVDEVGWQVAPGLTYSQWTEVRPRAPAQVFLLTARLDQPGLVLDQVSGPTVAARAPLSQWLSDDGAIAGVNADFFDINDTGAPLGVGADRQRRTLHAPRSGWNTSFLIDSRGVPKVAQDALVAKVVRTGKASIAVTTSTPQPWPCRRDRGLHRCLGSHPGRQCGQRSHRGARGQGSSWDRALQPHDTQLGNADQRRRPGRPRRGSHKRCVRWRPVQRVQIQRA